jgi:hypothetical protein
MERLTTLYQSRAEVVAKIVEPKIFQPNSLAQPPKSPTNPNSMQALAIDNKDFV